MENVVEKEYSDQVLSALSKNFYIQEQVWGVHFSGTKYRIDAILRPKDISKWRNPNVCFGIEFKLTEKLAGIKEKTYWINQCVNYANTKWDNYGYIYVFSCPSIIDELKNSVQDQGHLWNRVLSNMGIGKLQNHKYYGWTFYLQDSHRIWSQSDGVIHGKTWTLKRNFGTDFFKEDNLGDIIL